MTKQRKVYAQIAVGCLLISAWLFWAIAQADEVVFVDPWNARARLILVPEPAPRVTIIRPRATYQEPVDHCATKAQSESFCRGAVWCICANQEEEDGNQEEEKTGI